MASRAVQSLVVLPLFWPFLTIFANFVIFLAIFPTFCAFSQPYVDGFSIGFFVLKAEVSTNSNGFYSFAVAITVAEILKDLLGPF